MYWFNRTRFVGFYRRGLNDTSDDVTHLASKLLKLRIFEDDQGRLNRSLVEVSGHVLVVSQFTLYGDCRKGNRPSFTVMALPKKMGERLYHEFLNALRALGTDPESGRFGADMQVELLNEGPMTPWLESEGSVEGGYSFCMSFSIVYQYDNEDVDDEQ